MALVVFVRGANVGGHRVFRPAELARELPRLEMVNIGAAGTFVVRARVARAQLRAELNARLPFDAPIIICQGREIVEMTNRNPFDAEPQRPDVVHFVSVLARRPRFAPACPMSLPPTGDWLVRIIAHDNRFVSGVYRRQMKAIGHLGSFDRLFGVPATTRSWSTMQMVAKLLTR